MGTQARREICLRSLPRQIAIKIVEEYYKEEQNAKIRPGSIGGVQHGLFLGHILNLILTLGFVRFVEGDPFFLQDRCPDLRGHRLIISDLGLFDLLHCLFLGSLRWGLFKGIGDVTPGERAQKKRTYGKEENSAEYTLYAVGYHYRYLSAQICVGHRNPQGYNHDGGKGRDVISQEKERLGQTAEVDDEAASHRWENTEIDNPG